MILTHLHIEPSYLGIEVEVEALPGWLPKGNLITQLWLINNVIITGRCRGPCAPIGWLDVSHNS
jgi:hypothetical protein